MSKLKISNKSSKTKVTSKKISFFSSILLVIGSTIGSGIFLKNGEILSNVSNSIILSIVSWILSIIAVICMGLSLIEMTSGVSNDNGGITSWLRTYNHPILFKASKNFMAYIYFPVSAVVMPYYAIMMVQDAFGLQMEWWQALIASLFIALWFVIISGLSTKAGNIQNKIITYTKFLPLFFSMIVGFIIMICHQTNIGDDGWPKWLIEYNVSSNNHNLFISFFPGLGIIGSIPAITFSFDGFYTCTNLKSEMQQPEKIGQSMLYGLVIVSIIDIILSLSLLIGSQNGKINGLVWFNQNNYHWVISIIELLVGFSILGIVNGICMGQTKFYEHCIKINELYCPQKYKAMINNRSIVGVGYFLIIYFPVFLFVSLIGSFIYFDVNKYGTIDMFNILNKMTGTGYQIINNSSNIGNLNKLYSFCDLISNWSSIIAFGFILMAIFGCIVNRKTQRVIVKKCKYFLPAAIIASVILVIGLSFILISAIVNIPIVLSWKKDIGNSGYEYHEWFEQLIANCLTLFVLLFLIGISFLPAIFSFYRKKSNTYR